MRQDYQALLQFSHEWFTLGIVTESQLEALGREYETGEDPNTEHYRYGAFMEYLREHRPLSPAMAEALYELGARDPDHAMGSAMMHQIAELPECPPEVLENAARSGKKHLIRLVEKRRG